MSLSPASVGPSAMLDRPSVRRLAQCPLTCVSMVPQESHKVLILANTCITRYWVWTRVAWAGLFYWCQLLVGSERTSGGGLRES